MDTFGDFLDGCGQNVPMLDRSIAGIEKLSSNCGPPVYRFTLIAVPQTVRLFVSPPPSDDSWAVLPLWLSMGHNAPGAGTVLTAAANLRRIDAYNAHPRNYTVLSDDDIAAVVTRVVTCAKEALLSTEVCDSDKKVAQAFLVKYYRGELSRTMPAVL
jgi:hypothetical protein